MISSEAMAILILILAIAVVLLSAAIVYFANHMKQIDSQLKNIAESLSATDSK